MAFDHLPTFFSCHNSWSVDALATYSVVIKEFTYSTRFNYKKELILKTVSVLVTLGI